MKISKLEIYGILNRLPEYKNSSNPRAKDYAAYILSTILSEKGIKTEKIDLPRP